LYVAGNPILGGANHTGAATSGRYAGRKAAEYARNAPDPAVNPDQVRAEKARVYAPVKRDSGIGWKELHAGIARIMQDYCGKERHEALLKTGLRYFKEIRESEAANAYARNPHELLRVLDCLDRITCGEMIKNASLARKASSDWLNFRRIDYPEMDPPEWKKWITIKQKDGEVKVGELPINYWLLPPNAPTYEENYERHCSL
jgi:succinate dehydrogenase/fumarate reductase flavoprotein subunit